MKLGLVGLVFVAACSRSPRPEHQRDSSSGAMLDPARLDVLQPARIVAHLGLRPDAIVADVGSGPGAFTHALAAAVPRGRVIATDVREEPLRKLEADVRTAGERNVETRRVSPDETGLDPGSIDVAFLCQVDHYLRDRTAYLGRLASTLRPGGRVVIVNYTTSEAAVQRSATALGWREIDRWEPAPAFFARVYSVGLVR